VKTPALVRSAVPRDQSLLVERVRDLARAVPGRTAYTFADYGAAPQGAAMSLTWAEVDERARAVAVALRDRMLAGERAAVLAPQGLDYVVAMLGALYARVVAVPLFAPDLPGHGDRLVRILADAGPACVLTTEATAPSVAALLREHALGTLTDVIAVDRLGTSGAAGWRGEPIGGADVAYLQYTSGSTRAPAGVMITHGCLAANAAQIMAALGVQRDTATALSWLPLFHDMGFVLAVAMPALCNAASVFTDPVHFLMRPVRWLQLASGRTEVFTAGPNFAYEYCATRISEPERAGLDLSGVRAFINGAEPVRPATLDKFYRAFAGCGLDRNAMIPAYGLAEATVFVASGHPRRPARAVAFDRAALQRGDAVPRGETVLGDPQEPAPGSVPADGAAGAVVMVSCGVPSGQHVAIVDPRSARPCPPGRVGEIWVNGPNVSPGYFRLGPGEAFGAVLAAAPPGMPAGGWLRTGDTGVLHDGELIVTGRLKDLINIDGRNHYPQDVEATTQGAHPAIRRDRVAAFAAPGTDGDRLVVIAERARQVAADQVDPGAVARAVRAAVSARHGVRLHDFRLVRPGTVPRTSSGKIARSACRERYLAGSFEAASHAQG
jgi:acyl-CoA synthetase (AMP-forming)/AMP-acid ligase II